MNKIIVMLLSLLMSAAVLAADVDPKVQANIQATVSKVMPDSEVSSVMESPLPGIYEVVVGARIVYLSGDGRYVLAGDLMDIKERRNLSEERRAKARINAFAKIGPDNMIQFGPKDADHVLYVFTDIDCGYCRKLHTEMEQLNESGIAVRYLAFPRAGIGSESYDKFVAVWCAADQQKALTDAKAGRTVAKGTCENPVAEHYMLGQQMGVRGTPTIVLEDGEELGGYVPADQLARILGGG